MTRGRTPKPTELKLLQGNAGKRTLNTKEPKPELVLIVPPPPKNLGAVGKAEWKRLGSELVKLNLLSVLDTTMLEIYCDNYEQYRQSDKEIKTYFKKNKKYTVSYTNKGGHENEVPHPAIRVRRESLELLRSIGSEFGFSPSSRTRLKAPASSPDAGGLAAWLKLRRGSSG